MFTIGRGAFIALGIIALSTVAAAAPRTGLTLEKVVILQRHGVRPPTSSNEALAAYAEKPWPAWPVAAGELTPHGGETVRLVGRSLLRAYRDGRLAPSHGCPAADAIQVWADGADERTRHSGEILAETLAPGCAVKASWAPPLPRDPIFNGDTSAVACRVDPEAASAALLVVAGPGGIDTPATRLALKRLQAILAPTACAGGAGTCFTGEDRVVAGTKGPRLSGPLATTASLSEDLLLEYAEGMPRSQVGWGRAGSPADIAAVMPLHERAFKLYFGDPYRAARDGAPMARLILAALAGETRSAAPEFGPGTRLLALAGHDSNLALMGGLFGLKGVDPARATRRHGPRHGPGVRTVERPDDRRALCARGDLLCDPGPATDPGARGGEAPRLVLRGLHVGADGELPAGDPAAADPGAHSARLRRGLGAFARLASLARGRDSNEHPG